VFRYCHHVGVADDREHGVNELNTRLSNLMPRMTVTMIVMLWLLLLVIVVMTQMAV
jgi:hypothetical protein